MKNLNAISLFSSAGIGDLGLKVNNVDTVVACELLRDRADLFSNNYPNTKMFCGDIWKEQENIINYYRDNYDNPPFLILATPPCQGMSTNGMGRIINSVSKGKRPQVDPRNRLIIPTIHIIKALAPEWIVLENVSNMRYTIIPDETNNYVNIIEYIQTALPNYTMWSEVLDAADYGLAQHRKRLITVLSKKYPEDTQVYPAKYGKYTTLREAIGHLPPLRAELHHNQSPDITFHRVPIMDSEKLYWIDNTPEGKSAFDNQCNVCGFSGNTPHSGLYCDKCGSLLPRPYTIDKKTEQKRLIKGFGTSYKRMKWDEPSGTVTQNLWCPSSDNKLHPEQSRTLSIHEALILQGIDKYDYHFEVNGEPVSDKLIISAIGESVCPVIIDNIIKNIIKIESEN